MFGYQFANAKNRNWVKAALGFKYVRDGLEPFCDDIVNQLHADIINKVKQRNNLTTANCGQCNLRTLQPDHPRTKYKQCPLGQKDCNCQYPRGKVACPNYVCGAIYDEIINLHASTPPSPYWRNTDVKLWCSQPWAIAKCFINAPGYSRKSTASEIDCSGLLHILINNKGLQKHIHCKITGWDVFSEVRQHRNATFSSENMEMEDDDVVTYIDDMIDVLQDSKELGNRNESKSAVQKLLQLKQHDCIITAPMEATVRAELIELIGLKDELGQTCTAEMEQILYGMVASTMTPANDANDVEFDMSQDPRTRELYIKAINEGKEKDNDLRIMVVGCYRQGKSSLVRLLTGKTVEEGIISTNGIDVHLCDKDWDRRIIEDVASDRAKRLVVAAKTQSEPHFQEHDVASKDLSMFSQMSQQKDENSDNEIKLPEDEQIITGDTHACESICQSFTHSVNEEHAHNQFPANEEHATPKKKLKLQSDHLSTFAKEFEAHDSSAINEEKLNINIWDFGGQFVYYATHQLFHSKQAIYLLVFNLAQGLEVKLTDDDRPNHEQNKTMKDYLKFWVNSIHTFVGNEEGTEPKIFLVGTHLDELERDVDVKERFQAVRKIFEGSVLANHIRPENFAISNIKPCSETLNSIRKTIIEIGTHQSIRRTIPAKWIPLECSLREKQDMKIITFNELKEIDSRNEISVLSEEQLKLFLQFFHEKGTFFFFENTEDETNYVVIKPQFLIDAFKCIITAKDFCSRRPNLNKLWNRLCDEAILDKELLHELWKNDKIMDFSGFEKALLFFLQKHRIIAEALQFSDQTDEKHPLSLGFYIVPSLLKKPADGVIDQFLRRRKYTKVSLGYVFQYSSVLPTIYNRVIAAALGKWPVLKDPNQFMIYENVAGCKIGYEHADHAGLLQMKENTLELLVVNLVDDEVCSDECDLFRRFVELVMEQELRKFGMRNTDSQQSHQLPKIVRCFDEEHSFRGSTDVHKLETLKNHKKEKIPCPDIAKHHLNIKTIMQQWFKEKIFKTDIPRRQLTEMELSQLSTGIGNGWETLAHHLRITDVELDHINSDNGTTVKRIYEMLKKWKIKNGESATLDILVSAIEECKAALTFDDDKVKNLIDRF